MLILSLKSEPKGRAAPVGDGERGVALIMVLWAIALFSVLTLAALQEWQLEAQLTGHFLRKHQARHLAVGGIFYAGGKIVALKEAEANPDWTGDSGMVLWRADGTPNILEIGDQRLEIRITDEGGKINLNRASAEILINLFLALGYNETEAKRRTGAILSWRGSDFLQPQSRPDYLFYQRQTPPYTIKNRFFDTVEELQWVQGCGELSPGQLTELFTVQDLETGINLTTAALPVLQAVGLPAQSAVLLQQKRSRLVLENVEGALEELGLEGTFSFRQPVSFKSSNFFTILATGYGADGATRHTCKAIVRLQLGNPKPWLILYWNDDYPD